MVSSMVNDVGSMQDGGLLKSLFHLFYSVALCDDAVLL